MGWGWGQRKNKPKPLSLADGTRWECDRGAPGKGEAFCGNISMGIPAPTLKGPGSVFLTVWAVEGSPPTWTNSSSEPLLWAHTCVYGFTASRCTVRILGKNSIWHILCMQFCSYCYLVNSKLWFFLLIKDALHRDSGPKLSFPPPHLFSLNVRDISSPSKMINGFERPISIEKKSIEQMTVCLFPHEVC